MIELMVAMTLAIFIMLILSQAFVASLDTFSQLKATGDMQAVLRTGATVLRNDLIQDHFEGKRRLSDPYFNNERPREGFFVVGQGSALGAGTPPRYVYEGDDPDFLPSFRATDHWLHFTIKLRGNRRENFLYAPGPGLHGLATNYYNVQFPADSVFGDPNVYSSSWGEVAYFLVQTGTIVAPADPTAPGTPLYALYRCQFVVVPEPTAANNAAITTAQLPSYRHIACKPNAASGTLTFSGPGDMATNLASRTFSIASPDLSRANLLLTDVLSFQVRPMVDPTAVAPPYGFADVNYDSSSSNFNIHGVEITIRIWDRKSLQTRQVTLIQDL